MRLLLGAGLIVLAVGCSSAPKDDGITAAPAAPPVATAQSKSADPRLTQLEASVAELTERIDVLNDRIVHLEAGTDERRSESSAREVAQAAPVQPRSRQQTQPVGQPSTQRSPPAVQAPQSANPSSPVSRADIADGYRGAITLYGKNNFVESRKTFQQVYDADPTGDLADNALYWIGETYYAMADYTNAMKYYRRVVDEYPQQNKAPDALLKVGLVYVKIGDLLLARSSFEQLIARYPYSTPAGTAKTELKRIRY